MKAHDYLSWAALAAALVVTANAEYTLARECGYNQWVAGAVPGALDVYTVRALRSHRDVAASVIALVAVNAASHLLRAGMIPMHPALVIAVSAIAPLVLWRVHALRYPDHSRAASAEAHSVQSDASAEVQPTPSACIPDAVVQPDACIPNASAEVQSSVDAVVQPNAQPDANAVVQPTEVHLAAECSALLAAARALAADAPNGRVPLRRLQAELHIGQRRAQELQRALETLPTPV